MVLLVSFVAALAVGVVIAAAERIRLGGGGLMAGAKCPPAPERGGAEERGALTHHSCLILA